METKNLLKSLKRRLGLITAILAMLAVSQGVLAATYPANQTIYVKVPSSWVVNGKISMYVWGGSQSSGSWCGQNMTWVEDSGSDKIYKYTWSGTFTGFKITTNSCNTQANNGNDGSVSQTSKNSCIVATSSSYTWTTYTPPKMYTITFVDKNNWGSCYYYIPNNSTNCNWTSNGFSPNDGGGLKRFGQMTKSGDTYTATLSASDMNGKCITFAKSDQSSYGSFWQNEAVHCDNFDPEKETTCTSKTSYTTTNSTKYYEYAWGTPCTDPTSAGYTLSSTSFTYSGSGQAPTVTPKSGYGTPSTIKYGTDASGATTTKPTNVGTYHVYITGAASGSYCAYTNLDLGTFTISCANPTAAGYTLSPTSFTYSGSGQAPTVSPKSGYGTPSTTKYGTSTSSATTTKPTNIGTYHVYISGGASGNYCAYTNLDLGTFTISCANPTSAGYTLSSTSFTYSGSAQGPTVSPKTGYGSPTTTKYGTSASSATTTKPTNAGTYHVYITGAASGNYCAYTNLDLGTFTINQKTPTSADFTWDSMASYDGNPKSANVAWKSGTGSGTITTKYNGSTTQPSAAGEYTLTIDVAAAGNYGVASNINLGKFTVSGCSAPTVTTLPQVSPNQNIADPKVVSARYSISGGTCDITSAGVNVYVDASCTNKKYELTNSASGSTAKDTDIAFDVTLKENTIYYVKAFVTLDGGSTVESATAQTYFTFPVLPTTTGAENTDCGKFVAKASTDLTSKEDGGTAKFSSYSVTFRVWDNSVAVTGYGTPNTYYTKTASGVSSTTASVTFNITSDVRQDDKATKMQMGSTYKYIAYYTLSNVTFSDRSLTMFSKTYSGDYAPKSFTIPAPSITPDVNSITFATHVVLGQESSALKIANYTFCGHSFTTSDFALTGDNATDFTLTQQSVISGTASVKIRFTPKSGIGVKTANLVVKEGGNVISTIPVSATADCITPTKANYSVSGNVHTYDGSPKTAVITPNTGTYGKFTAGTATYGGAASQTNVGNYTIHYNVPVGGNYCATNFDFDEKLTISKATFPDITGLPTETVILCSGLTEQLTPVCAGATFTYSSNATGVATVNGSGRITAVAAGNATITVTATNPNYNDKSATVTVQVKTTPSVTITASPASVGPWEISSITVTPSAGTAAVELWKGGSEVSPTDADVVFEGSGTAYKLKAANKTASSITYTVKATATSEGCTSAEATKDIPVTKAATEVCQ